MNGLQIEDDVEQAMTKEFQLPRGNTVCLAVSEAIIWYWSNPKNHENYSTKRNNPKGSWKMYSQAMTEYLSDPKIREVMSQLMIAHWVNPVHVLNLEEYIVKR